MRTTILFVDDERSFSELIKVHFRNEIKNDELEFFFAHDGIEALELLDKHRHIEMVISDINMPRMNGLMLLKEVSKTYSSIKTIVISAYGDIKNIRAAMNYGAYDFLTKPLQINDLTVTIEKTIEAISKERQLFRSLESTRVEKFRRKMELQTATTVQQALFPKQLPAASPLEIAAHYRAGKEIGGNWYSFMSPRDDNLFLLIGNVSGHGMPAALITATVSATCMHIESWHDSMTENHERRRLNPSILLEYINNNVYRVGAPSLLMSFFAARIDLKTGTMVYCNASHLSPILFREGSSPLKLSNENPFLGENQKGVFQESEIELQKDDFLLLHTDGFVENQELEGEKWTSENFDDLLESAPKNSSKEFIESVLEYKDNFFSTKIFNEDLTCIACKVIDNWEN